MPSPPPAGTGTPGPPARAAIGRTAAAVIGSAIAAFDDLHEIQVANGLFLEALHHGFEHVEGLALVLHQRIVLSVAAQADAFAQVVHAEQVVFPLLIEHAQHDDALVMAHRVRADELFLGVVALLQLVEDGVAQFLPIQLVGVDALFLDVHAEAGEDLVLQALDVPVRGTRVLVGVLVEQACRGCRARSPRG